MYKLTFVENTFDNTITLTQECNWEEVCQLFSVHNLMTKGWLKPHGATNGTHGFHKELGMMFIPASFKDVDYIPAMTKNEESIKYREDGTPHIKRCKDNLDLIYFIPLDFDGNLTLEEIVKKFRGYQYLCYTSSSHQSDRKGFKDCARVLLPLKEPITALRYKQKGRAIREWIGNLDESSVDLARGFYMPTYYPGEKEKHLFWSQKSRCVDANDFEDEVEEVYKQQLSQHTGITNGNGKVLWDTCDVVSMFQSQGWYLKKIGANKHEVRCPWESEHSSGGGGTIIYERTDRPAAFTCRHGHCKDRRMKDVKELIGWKEVAVFCDKEQPVPSIMEIMRNKKND